MEIRELKYEELESASRVLWLSFYFAEKNNHTMEGMERFRDLVSPLSLSMNFFDGSAILFGAFVKGELSAVGAVKDQKKILLLYVLPQYAGKGIGSSLLSFLEEKCNKGKITLNASDCAVPFYEKRGYRKTGERKIEEHLIFTPMEKVFSCNK